ncbi:MAG TPA: hydroxymethylbilane synthase [Chitinophagales bacterium]|nr:hydroxymethylbilane synthase [Chitinophagales bacterium]
MKGKNTPIIIGTRGSELALWQANYTKSVLEEQGFMAELKIIKTKGDATQQWNLSFDKMEGKGFFTKELEDALLAGEIDMAVHSCKDLPTNNPEGLTISAYSKRANPFDILLIHPEGLDDTKMLQLKENALVGTSSARRKTQLQAFRPDIELKDLRGNVPTRVGRLRNKEYDAIVLASAGLERLQVDLSDFIQVPLRAPMFIPAPAQGVLAYQIRENDTAMQSVCRHLQDEATAEIAQAERQVLHDFDGGCQMPLGVYAEKVDGELLVWVAQSSEWKQTPKRMLKRGFASQDSQIFIDKLKSNQPSAVLSVFITSDLSSGDYLIDTLNKIGYSVNNESFIEFEKQPFEMPEKVDWLFFSSKNGVKYFLEGMSGKSLPEGVKLAAINQGTALALKEQGLAVHFTGSGNDLEAIAHHFGQMANGDKVLFPQAKKSMQSVQKYLQYDTDSTSLVVYTNRPKQQLAERAEDILVFTSPLSAQAYFTLYPEGYSGKKIVSIGKTTTRKLQEMHVPDIHTAYEPTPWSLLDEIIAL